MEQSVNLLSGFVMRTGTKLIKVLNNQENELYKCSNVAKRHIREGVRLASSGLFKQAIEQFEKASKADKTCVAARLNLIKAYMASDKDLQALFLGGVALSISKQDKTKAKIFNFMGNISEEIFLLTKQHRHLQQAKHFFTDAHSYNKEDIIPAWNLVEINLLGWRSQQEKNETTARDYYQKAESRMRYLMQLLTSRSGNTVSCIADVAKQAELKLSGVEGKNWQLYLAEIQSIAKSCEMYVPENRPDKNKYSTTKAAIAAAVVMAAIAGTSIISASPETNTDKPPMEQFENTPQREKEHNAKPSVEMLELDEEASNVIAVTIQHSWEEVKGVDHGWAKV